VDAQKDEVDIVLYEKDGTPIIGMRFPAHRPRLRSEVCRMHALQVAHSRLGTSGLLDRMRRFGIEFQLALAELTMRNAAYTAVLECIEKRDSVMIHEGGHTPYLVDPYYAQERIHHLLFMQDSILGSQVRRYRGEFTKTAIIPAAA
jgi:hypothetical protein